MKISTSSSYNFGLWILRYMLCMFCSLSTHAVVSNWTSPRLEACRPNSNLGTKNGVCVCNDGDNPVVRCIQVPNMFNIPANILNNVQILVINDAKIDSLSEYEFDDYLDLESLDLRNCEIRTIHSSAFRNLYKLTYLNLQYNRMTRLDPSGRTFQFLTSLRILDVSGNGITTINPHSFLTIVPVKTDQILNVQLRNNKIQCSCDVYFLKKWLEAQDSSHIEIVDLLCENDAQKRSFTSIPDKDYIDCSSQRLISDEISTCRNCSSLNTSYDCNLQSSFNCPKNYVCKRSIAEVGNSLRVSSGCSPSMKSCFRTASSNKDTCSIDSDITDFSCNYCCTNYICDRSFNIEGFNNFEYSLTYFRDSTKGSYLALRESNKGTFAYEAEKQRLVDGMSTVVKISSQGSFSFHFVKYETGLNKVVMKLAVTISRFADEQKFFQENKIMFSDDNPRSFFAKEINRSMPYSFVKTENGICPRTRFNYFGTARFWPESYPGETALLSCSNPDVINTSQYALRMCEMVDNTAVWKEVDISRCWDPNRPSEETTQRSTIARVTSTTSTTKTTTTITTTREPITLPPDTTSDYSPQEAQKVTSDILKFIKETETFSVEQVGKMVTNLEKVSNENNLAHDNVAASVLMCITGLIDTNPDTLKDSEEELKTSSRLLNLIDIVSENAPLQGGKFEYSSPSLAVAARGVAPGETRNIVLSEVESSNNKLGIQVGYDRNQPNPEEGYSDIVIPTQSIFKSLTSSERQNFKRITFSVHNDSKLFDSMQSHKKQEYERNGVSVSDNDDDDADDDDNDDSNRLYLKDQVNGRIIAASIPGMKIQNLDQNITMTFEHAERNASNPECVYWDPKLIEGKGDWTSKGCGVVRSDEKSTTCGCNHLTNFALLMDIYQESGGLSSADRKALSIISYIGCSISLLALFLTLFTYSLFKEVNEYHLSHSHVSKRKLRRDTPSKILINLCVALLMSNLVFLVGMQDYTFDSTVACKVVAVLLHYFMLASLCWMLVEAFYMYLALVIVFKTYFSNMIFKISLFGWGVPAVVIAVTLGVNSTDNYGLLGTGLCWLKIPAFYIAFVAPVCLILLLNCLAFGLVARQLMQMSSGKLNTSDRFSTIQRLRGAVGVVILLGLTWLFAIFAIDSASVPFYYLFAVFNTLQGLFIFIFYCLFKSDAKTSWKKFLSCCFDTSDLTSTSGSRAATYKASSSDPNVTTRRKISNSSVNNTLSTTASTLVGSNRSSSIQGNIYDTLDSSFLDNNDSNYLMLKTAQNDKATNQMAEKPQQTRYSNSANFTSNVDIRKVDHGLNHVYNNQPSKYQIDKSTPEPLGQSSPPAYRPSNQPLHSHSQPEKSSIVQGTTQNNNVSVMIVNNNTNDKSDNLKPSSVSEIRLRFESTGSSPPMNTHL